MTDRERKEKKSEENCGCEITAHQHSTMKAWFQENYPRAKAHVVKVTEGM
jgi:hypothetical protein